MLTGIAGGAGLFGLKVCWSTGFAADQNTIGQIHQFIACSRSVQKLRQQQTAGAFHAAFRS